MITVKITIDDIDYESVIDVVKWEASPSFFKKIGFNIASFWAKHFISQKRKDKLVVSYCQNNKEFIINTLEDIADKQGIKLSIKNFEVE